MRGEQGFALEAELLRWGLQLDAVMDQPMSDAAAQRMLDLWFALQTAMRQLQG